MNPLASIRYQLLALRDEATRLTTCEFPYNHGKEAVERIITMCSFNLLFLDRLTWGVPLNPVASKLISEAALYVTNAVPCLGFILRSTNVRNAFEVHGPLLRLARKIVDNEDLKLILSSEWFATPVNFLNPPSLSSNFVLIGQPATESSNPFIIPLAGHELGHSVWELEGLAREFKSTIQRAVTNSVQKHKIEYEQAFQPAWDFNDLTDLIATSDLEPIVRWCSAQVEEIFCDALGVALFGKAFLCAFAYQLATLQHTGRSAGYPPLLKRIQYHLDVANWMHAPVPAEYKSWFVEEIGDHTISPQLALQLTIADDARSEIAGNIMTRALNIVKSRGLLAHSFSLKPENSDDESNRASPDPPGEGESPSQQRATPIPAPSETPPSERDHGQLYRSDISSCVEQFRRFTPAERAHSLSDIVNAAWEALEAKSFFGNESLDKEKFAHLSEIVLKSIEIHEIEQCLLAENIPLP